MVEIKSVVILGAGALGAAYASMLYDMDNTCVSLAASGERYQRLKADGLVVNHEHYAIPVLSPDEESSSADLIIVALKHHHLSEALPALKNQVGDNTVFLSVMNGLDSEAIIGSVYGEEKVLYGIAVGIDPLRSGNVINYTTGGTIFFGEADNAVLTDRVKTIQALFDRAGIGYRTPTDMIRIMWWKFMINVGTNQASAVLKAPYGVFQTSKHARKIMETAMREVIVIAEAADVDLAEEDIEDWYTFMNTLHPDGKTSMLQDIEAGRVTEVDIFGGKVIELGKTYGIPTPVNEVLFHAVNVIEQRAMRSEE
jgi:2-dehydropantoate 2-reductase